MSALSPQASRPPIGAKLTRALSHSGRLPLSYCGVGRIVAIGEFLLVLSLAISCGAAYRVVFPSEDFERFIPAAVTAALLYCVGMQSQHLYRPSAILRPVGVSQAIIVNWIVVFGVLLMLGFLTKVSGVFSRSVATAFFLSGIVVLPISRMAASRAFVYALENNYLGGRRRVAVFGDRRQFSARSVVNDLAKYGYKVSSQFDVFIEDGNLLSNGRRISEAFNRLRSFIQENRVDEIFLVFATSDRRSIDLVSSHMRELPIPVRLLFDQGVSRFLSDSYLDLGAAKAVKLQSGPLTENQQLSKRIVDVVLSSFGLVVLAPVMVAIAAAIRIESPGPVIFRQRRAGFGGRTFYIYKFRSMTSLDDGQVIQQAIRGDKRVTRVGRYLRKASLDELPQLLNVLRGEMSLVGPRPHAISHDNQYNKLIATYALRHHMKPGITGWAQVNGCRGETSDLSSMEARVECDLWYIVHWKFMLDVKIILLTVLQVLRPQNVY